MAVPRLAQVLSFGFISGTGRSYRQLQSFRFILRKLFDHRGYQTSTTIRLWFHSQAERVIEVE